jgi:Neuraminidase-like domain/ABC toxin N-terminal region
MKRFRLWEANRKIFLYPENWFDPSQRRDKSPYFVALEGALQQTDLTNDVAEDALRDYLHKLSDVSHLEVSGLFEERLGGTTQPVLHVVARTRKTPYMYSYRRREAIGTWSPWEPLDPGIQANHIMPALWNNRLYMLWTEFTQKPLPTTPADRKVPMPGQNVTVNDVQKYWEITLAWIEKRSGVWLPKRQSQRKQLFPDHAQRGLLFRTALQQRNLAVELYQPEVFDTASSPIRAQWSLTSPQDDPVLLLQQQERGGAIKDIDDIRYIAALTGGASRVGNKPPKHGDPVNGDERSNNITLHFNAYGGDNPGKTGILRMVKLDNQGNAT